MSGVALAPCLSHFLLPRSPLATACSSFANATTTLKLHQEEAHRELPNPRSMTQWWGRAVGQRFNTGGVASVASVVAREPHLALPHLSVPDIRWIDWAELARIGIRGVVFDKDNTLTAPYSLSLFPPLARSLQQCRSALPGKVAIYSNSAGLYQYDPDGEDARALEDSIGGIRVIRGQEA